MLVTKLNIPVVKCIFKYLMILLQIFRNKVSYNTFLFTSAHSLMFF